MELPAQLKRPGQIAPSALSFEGLTAMYPYPPEFPERSRARVHTEQIRSVRDFEHAKQGARYKPKIEALLRTCILRVFLVFAEEAAELGRRGIWRVGKMEEQAT